MKKILLLLLFLLIVSVSAQKKELKLLLKKHNNESIPYISVDELKKELSKVILLDAREPIEFKVSHIKNALPIGYNHFNIQNTVSLIKNKNAKVIVYCSIGIRSEDIAEELKKAGFLNVYNLYGGIFKWKNKENIVVSNENKLTEQIHIYSKEWGKWLLKGEKTY